MEGRRMNKKIISAVVATSVMALSLW